MVLRMRSGMDLRSPANALIVVLDFLSSSLVVSKKRDDLSMQVNKAARCPEKCIKSASQCPGAARRCALVGRM